MNVDTDSTGQRWSNRCDLCRNTRVLQFSGLSGKREQKCPWCDAVRMKYGNYWYPINDTNKHLFP